ncbi:phosphate ABC transporter permease PstA [Vibrio sp. Sgm 22]|uniref:phosphate ABC transporter permease PstA n=1 Tax=unclassified Vibrio TaxID=2614977 RepID=UPI002248F6BB|nr:MULTISPECIES: phosphate ABC transporter permease PstA [unclassified Vibrio]MCX2760682.1 phosphate ABC transporter permease PstA [Vibrio sp. 14G-20]MCX2777752.1 phosphate ABC transporter permease PstA [Vibrio sp. Sgm 22]
MNLRKFKNGLFYAFCIAATATGLIVLSSILYTLIGEGIKGLKWSLFTELTPAPGSEGGLKNAIYGSLILTGMGIAIAAPLGVLAGTWLSEAPKENKTAETLRFLNGMLVSAPSILVGLFIYAVIVVPMGSYSAWAGAIALAILALPVIISSTEEMLRLVPPTLKEAGSGLGAPKWRVITKLSYRAAGPGIVTAILLSIARISGETAPLLFTALNSSFMTTDMGAPMANLPVTIYQFAMSPYSSWQELAWAGALLITSFILFINILATSLPKYLKARKA